MGLDRDQPRHPHQGGGGQAGALDAMDVDEVVAVLEAAATVDPVAGLALRVATVAGARWAELAALRCDELRGSVLTVDSAVIVVRSEDGPVLVDGRTKNLIPDLLKKVLAGIGGMGRPIRPGSLGLVKALARSFGLTESANSERRRPPPRRRNGPHRELLGP